ncbi:U32 family peptidase [Porphyromonas sp.]|uniref:peptidase U32 family protein n=1 Tax=Porphyromonas sp. TaxID=1924944 RepID=UPI0026DAC9DA|nr:U32 family peptidase [Porphyromonas sp.]MDO4695318.1 U32 family peptidase [Porphyromonas sp.]MDO4771019.1 U32 family peptidase [Porphyromonas sp.]
MSFPLELLAPAKNADYGIEAIKHGADAVYIGAPAFGARVSAGNSIEDIQRLVTFAHLFGAKVYIALNTILRDDELQEARSLITQLYEIGADAIIIQDFGLLEGDLPPIPLHASTQMDNITVERIQFLLEQGFEQVVVPRELSPNQIRKIHKQVPNVKLECFIHGALCVSYSGRCYAAAEFHGRSANRGSCSQICRLPFDLIDAKGNTIVKNKHLLSVKDLNRSEILSELITSGVSSFKIEGRLKDLSYVKTVVAHYHQLLNDYILEHPEYSRSSYGDVAFSFAPNVDRVFNRGYTMFAHNGRREDQLAAFDSPKSMGERVGKIVGIRGNMVTLQVDEGKAIANGDGLAFYLPEGGTSGLKVNVANGDTLTVNKTPDRLRVGMPLHRNLDIVFDREMEKNTAIRKLPISFELNTAGDELCLTALSQNNIQASVSEFIQLEDAQNSDTKASIVSVLSKCGNTEYKVSVIDIENILHHKFIPKSLLTKMRQRVLERLTEALLVKALQSRPNRPNPLKNSVYPEANIGYTANIFNNSALSFYAKHGSRVDELAYESKRQANKPLMYTKHCIRYSLGMCPHLQGFSGKLNEPWGLHSLQNRVSLKIVFDCKRCEMVLYKY